MSVTKMFADPVTGVRRLFYAVTPNETSFAAAEEVPDYFFEAIPYYYGAILLEFIVSFLEGKAEERFSLADTIGSLTTSALKLCMMCLIKGFEIVAFIAIHTHFKLLDLLPWDSTWTWIIAYITVDFMYYWFHRMVHEINIFWATHQVHSSQELNLSTSLRASVFQRFIEWLFYAPLAILIPLSAIVVHKQLNIAYQFCIHTQVIKSLGPLEYVLNTPSHHRVHHSRNRSGINKNYGGVLIIWDRLFGTFEPEQEKLVYGLVHPLQTWDPIHVQLCHLQHMWQQFWMQEGLTNKFRVILYGPGWEPGKPRLGNIEDIPDVKYPLPKYRPLISGWYQVYISLHFVVNVVLVLSLYSNKDQIHASILTLSAVSYLVYSFKCVGALCDGRSYAPAMELLRCVLAIIMDSYITRSLPHYASIYHHQLMVLRIIYGLSTLIWISDMFLNGKTSGEKNAPLAKLKVRNSSGSGNNNFLTLRRASRNVNMT